MYDYLVILELLRSWWVFFDNKAILIKIFIELNLFRDIE